MALHNSQAITFLHASKTSVLSENSSLYAPEIFISISQQNKTKIKEKNLNPSKVQSVNVKLMR